MKGRGDNKMNKTTSGTKKGATAALNIKPKAKREEKARSVSVCERLNPRICNYRHRDLLAGITVFSSITKVFHRTNGRASNFFFQGGDDRRSLSVFGVACHRCVHQRGERKESQSVALPFRARNSERDHIHDCT